MFKQSLLYSVIIASALAGRVAYADPEIDDFERNALGGNWRVLAGGASTNIVNNSDLGLRDNTAGFGLVSWSTTAFTADQYSEAVISLDKNAEMLTQVFVRWRSSDSARYAFHYAGDPRQTSVFGKWEIKYDGVPGPQTRSLATATVGTPLQAGDMLRVEVTGFTIKGFHNGVEVISATDNDMVNRISSGEPGLAYRWATDMVPVVYPAPVWERWSAGSLVAPPPASADITVLDSSGSATDLQVSFGNVVETASADRSVTIRNDGGVDLALQQIAVGNPLAPPFSIQTNNCMPGMLTPNASCSFAVRFSPLSVGTFNDTFDIPSNDPDENPVTVSVSGTGTDAFVPDITVLDTSGNATDLQVSFGNVVETASADRSVTIRNDGGVDLALQQIAVGNPLAPPFSIQTNNCMPGMLTPNVSCSFVVRFSPLSVGTFNDTFNISSNDPDENPVTVSVSGTGVIAGTVTVGSTDNSGGSSGSLSWLLILFATVTAYLRKVSSRARSSLS